MWEKEKMLVTSIFSISRNDFRNLHFQGIKSQDFVVKVKVLCKLKHLESSKKYPCRKNEKKLRYMHLEVHVSDIW